MSVGKKIAERILSERPAPVRPLDPLEWQRTIDVSVAVRGSRYIDVVVKKMESGAVAQTLMHSVMDTIERETRKRLIALGWTPPAGSAPTPPAGPLVDLELIKQHCEQGMLADHNCPAVDALDAINRHLEALE